VTVGGTVRRDGWTAVEDVDALLPTLGALVPPDAPTGPDIGVVHRRVGEADVYFVANTGPSPRAVTLRPRDAAAAFERWDARTGRAHRVETHDGGVPLELQPYEAAVVVALPAPDADVPAEPAAGPVETVDLPGPWTIAFAPDAPQAVALPHRWEDDPARADYSGAATYETTVDVAAQRLDGRVLLDLGPVRARTHAAAGERGLRGASFRADATAPVGEVAQVLVNGHDCGWAWAPPYSVDVTDRLRAGENTIAVRVLNTGIGALRTATELTATVEAVTRIDGKRFRMQDLELAQQPTNSGLREVPALRFQQPADQP
jgi:hypothetical protein